MLIRSLTLRLQPTQPQRQRLESLIKLQRQIYNAALEERIGAWMWERRSVSKFDQVKTLTGATELTGIYGSKVCQGTLRRLDEAFKSFFRRIKRGEKPGFPRFRGLSRFDSVSYPNHGNCCKLNKDNGKAHGRLYLRGIGHLKVVGSKRHPEGKIKTVTVKRRGRRWEATVTVAQTEAREPLPGTGQSVGIDLGILNQIATSDGKLVSEGRFGRGAQAELARAQRDLATKTKGSNRRHRAKDRVSDCYRKIRNQRKDLAHQLSRQVVNDYDLIVHEDLKITNMIHKPSPETTGLNRSINDAGWGQLLQFITYKAEEAGREVIAVDPRHTSQTCFECGHVAEENRKTQAEFRCQKCGHTDHADVNAAQNIKRLGLSQRKVERPNDVESEITLRLFRDGS